MKEHGGSNTGSGHVPGVQGNPESWCSRPFWALYSQPCAPPRPRPVHSREPNPWRNGSECARKTLHTKVRSSSFQSPRVEAARCPAVGEQSRHPRGTSLGRERRALCAGALTSHGYAQWGSGRADGMTWVPEKASRGNQGQISGQCACAEASPGNVLGWGAPSVSRSWSPQRPMRGPNLTELQATKGSLILGKYFTLLKMIPAHQVDSASREGHEPQFEKCWAERVPEPAEEGLLGGGGRD